MAMSDEKVCLVCVCVCVCMCVYRSHMYLIDCHGTCSPWILSIRNGAQAALQSFCIANNIEEISPEDEIYKYDVDKHKTAVEAAAWTEKYV